MPPRGPRRVLWVVVVTKSACGKGLGCRPAATSPAMCAISTIKSAPQRRAMDAKSSKSTTPVVAPARQPFRVLIRHHGAQRLEHSFADEVLRSYQLQGPRLAVRFVLNGAGDFGIDFLQGKGSSKRG